MIDSSFYKNKGPFSLKEICTSIKCDLVGSYDKIIEDLSPIEEASEKTVCFLSDNKYREYLKNIDIGALIVKKNHVNEIKGNLIISKNPHYDMAMVASLFYPDSEYPSFTFSSLDKNEELDKSIKLSFNSFIHKDARIGKNCEIGNNSIIGPGVVLGNNCLVGDNVSIYFSLIGNNVKIYQGVKLGSEGFGFVMNEDRFKKIPQLGRVIIENNVEIGANTTVDRGSIGDTQIGEFSMIDNMVHLGHNVRIGKKCIIAAMTGISGSTSIGDNVMLGGQVGISGHIKIGNNVKVAAKTGIMKDIPDGSVIAGYPSEKIMDWHRNTIIMKNLRKNDKKQ